MTKVTIDRELLERIDESAICDGTDATISDDLFTQLVAALAAPRQPEGEGLEVVGYTAQQDIYWQGDCTIRKTAMLDYDIPLCRLSDAQRAIAELRDRLDVMNQCADNYSRMFEESAEECEHWKSGANAEAARADELKAERDTLRQQLADARDEIAKHSNDLTIAYMAGSADMRKQRDKLAQILRDLVPGCKWRIMRPRIDAALAEVNK